MLLIHIDKAKRESIFNQIVSGLISLISDGTLKEGHALPSSRQLAGQLGVNRSTVVRAYEELWALGYVESTAGSYTRVRKRKDITRPEMVRGSTTSYENSLFSGSANRSWSGTEEMADKDAVMSGQAIDFRRLEPDPGLIDNKGMGRVFRASLAGQPADLFGYCHPRGYKPLREELLRHMRLHSVYAADENILITSGTQNSIQLILQAFVSKDDYVVIESPTYSMLIPLLRLLGIKVLEVPVEADGMNLKVLTNILHSHKVRLIYTMPGFHNPTGITMSQQKREILLRLCEDQNIILVEDSFEEEMKYFGKVHLPVKSMDYKGVVVYLSSFSKVLAPGFRIGWIIADAACIRRLTELKTAQDLSSATISQVILYRYCKSGLYELHIRKLMRVFRRRMQVALHALKAFVHPDKASWDEPLGGFLIWIRIFVAKEGHHVFEHLRENGVLVSPGEAFFYTPSGGCFIRLSIARLNEDEILEGIKRLGRALQRI